jgi:hypothetical protein
LAEADDIECSIGAKDLFSRSAQDGESNLRDYSTSDLWIFPSTALLAVELPEFYVRALLPYARSWLFSCSFVHTSLRVSRNLFAVCSMACSFFRKFVTSEERRPIGAARCACARKVDLSLDTGKK